MRRLRLAAIVGSSLALPALLPAQVVIQGEVSAEGTGAPVVGANVVVKGTGQGGATDVGGKFRFIARTAYPLTLEITHIAYQSREVVLASDTSLVIVMVPHLLRGEDVIVTGVGTRAEAEISSAVELITLPEIEIAGAGDVSEILRPLASVRVETAPFGRQTVSIRGSNANEVVVFLDGIRLNDAYTGAADLVALDLSDIARVEIVKGGNSTLYSQGAFGGALILFSRKPDGNHLSLARGYGLSDETDQDLSVSGSLRLGPLAAGGRYTGKSRLYDGRTLFTSLHAILSAAIYFPFGELTARQHAIEDFIQYPSGFIVQGDTTTLTGVNYRGSFLGFRNIAVSVGKRAWEWNDNFFTSLQRELQDEVTVYRASKSTVRGPAEITLQVERENQDFRSRNAFLDADRDVLRLDDGQLSRSVRNYALVAKWVADSDHPAVEHVKFEAGYRLDVLSTDHDQQLWTFTTSGDRNLSSDYAVVGQVYNHRTRVLRLGYQIEGHTSTFDYDLFINQGSNQRAPSLSDLFRYQGNPSASRDDPLQLEQFSSTEIGLRVKYADFPRSPALSWIEFRFDLFYNSYLEKIGYRPAVTGPPVPFNRNTAEIRGTETALRAAWWEERLTMLAAYQHLSLSDPLVFPNKPEHRWIYQLDLALPWFHLRYDLRREGRQYIIADGWLAINSYDRQNANLSLMATWSFRRLKISAVYTVRNLNSDQPSRADPVGNLIVPFEYFEPHRQIVTLRVEF